MNWPLVRQRVFAAVKALPAAFWTVLAVALGAVVIYLRGFSKGKTRGQADQKLEDVDKAIDTMTNQELADRAEGRVKR